MPCRKSDRAPPDAALLMAPKGARSQGSSVIPRPHGQQCFFCVGRVGPVGRGLILLAFLTSDTLNLCRTCRTGGASLKQNGPGEAPGPWFQVERSAPCQLVKLLRVDAAVRRGRDQATASGSS